MFNRRHTDQGTERILHAIDELGERIFERLHTMANTIQDLSAAITSLEAQETTNAADVVTALNALKAAAPADLQPSIDRITAQVAKLKGDDTSLEAAAPSTPPVTPPPTTP